MGCDGCAGSIDSCLSYAKDDLTLLRKLAELVFCSRCETKHGFVLHKEASFYFRSLSKKRCTSPPWTTRIPLRLYEIFIFEHSRWECTSAAVSITTLAGA